MNNKDIKSRVDRVIQQFPLKASSGITPDLKLFEVVNLFSSLLNERVKARLEDEFPNTCFDKLNSSTTIDDIYNLVIDDSEELSIQPLGTLDRIKQTSDQDFIESQKTFPSVGIDMESLDFLPDEIFNIKSTSLRKRLFTELEVVYAITKVDPKLTLLGIYSAKESIIKAINPAHTINYIDIEIKHTKSGKPFAKVKGFSSKLFDLSISHCINFAISTCIYFPDF